MKRLDQNSKNILGYKPNITYIEPEVQPGSINPISEDLPELEDVNARIQQIYNLANAVNVLATAIQQKVDDKAKNFKVKLDPKVDAPAIAAMRRLFPPENINNKLSDASNTAQPTTIPSNAKGLNNNLDTANNTLDNSKDPNKTSPNSGNINTTARNTINPNATKNSNDKVTSTDPYVITYAQYRKCRDHLREHARKVGQQVIIPQSAIDKVQADADAAKNNKPSSAASKMGGNNTDAANNGGLRPELDSSSQIITNIDIETVQIKLICILVNFIWKNFILKAFDFSIAGVSITDYLPSKLCDAGAKIEIPDLFLLGDKKIPDILSGKKAVEAAKVFLNEPKLG